MDTDVIIVGAAPTGLMLAGELQLAGVRSMVLERLPEPWPVAKAGGLGGRILDVLRHRGLLERFEAASGVPRPAPRFPFGGLHVDLTELADPPMQAVLLPQPQMESLLQQCAAERGADIRRGHELTGLKQDHEMVTAQIGGLDGPYRLTARYLVGCDGVGSRVRELTGIEFPGVTYPEVNRLAAFVMPAGVRRLPSGDFEIDGFGRIAHGYSQTERGVFAISSYTGDDLSLYTAEDESQSYDDNTPMTVAEMRQSVSRVLGADIALGEASRLTRFTYHARHAVQYRSGRVLLAGDAAHVFPSGGVAVNAGMLDAVNLAWKLAASVAGWAPAGLLDSYHDERHLAGERTLLHTRAQVALRRGLDPAADALRRVVAELLSDEPARRRVAAMIAASDIRYPMPGSGDHGVTGTFIADLPVGSMQSGRPLFLDSTGRADLHDVVREWAHRVDIRTDQIPTGAQLIRPDGVIAWATGDGAGPEGLREALSHWFGEPKIHHDQISG